MKFRITYTCDVELGSWAETTHLLNDLGDGISDRIDEVMFRERPETVEGCDFDEITFTRL